MNQSNFFPEIILSIIFFLIFVGFILWFGLTNQAQGFYSEYGIRTLQPHSVTSIWSI